MNKIQSITQLCSVALLCALLAACGAKKIEDNGYVSESDIKTLVIVGQTTKDEVQTKLGSPSSQSTFGAETWYYITDKKESYLFLKPDIVEQHVTEIEFDPSGVASKVNSYDLKDGKQIALAKRTTPTEGHSLGFFEQLVGNVGRFNNPASNSNNPGPGRNTGGGAPPF